MIAEQDIVTQRRMQLELFGSAMLKIGTTRKERCGDYVRTLQVVGYNQQQTHEVCEIIREQYNPLSIDYKSLTPKRFDNI